jgi:hypothetical protein
MSIDSPSPSRALVTFASLGLLALLSLGPLLVEPSRDVFLKPYSSTTATGLALGAVLFLMALTLLVRVHLDRPSEPHAARNMALFATLAFGMTIAHWIEVDRFPRPHLWQQIIYLRQFCHLYEAPHNYRPLPHGFVCLLERTTHLWDLACVSYRWFFTVWFLWASHRLARRYLEPSRALWTLVPLVLLYPLSILHYWGQLTDPLSLTLFVLAFLYLLEDRPLALAAALVLGIFAKETAVIIVPAYLACHWRRGVRTWLITAALGAVCVAAYLAVRLPLGWRPEGQDINGVGLVIGPNLGYTHPKAILIVPLWENLLHPVLFVGAFVPFILLRWRYIHPHLRALFLVVTPLLLLSSLCFGWLYESRNYMPLVPLLATMALTPARREAHCERSSLQTVGI